MRQWPIRHVEGDSAGHGLVSVGDHPSDDSASAVVIGHASDMHLPRLDLLCRGTRMSHVWWWLNG